MSIWTTLGFASVAASLVGGAMYLDHLTPDAQLTAGQPSAWEQAQDVQTVFMDALPEVPEGWSLDFGKIEHVSTQTAETAAQTATYLRGGEVVMLTQRRADEKEAAQGLLADFERKFKSTELKGEKRVSVLGEREGVRFYKVPAENGDKSGADRYMALVADEIAIDVVSTASEAETWNVLKTYDFDALRSAFLGKEAETVQVEAAPKPSKVAKCRQQNGRKVCKFN
ncbi:MAG: hypothetical protein AAGD04_04800 [Pseudomonadota bacterium]